MPTLEKIERIRNRGKRPTDNAVYCGSVWLVEKGEEFDLVQFTIKELKKSYYWREHLCVPCNWTDDEVEKAVREYVKNYISDKEIKDFTWFLEMGEKWGWD